MRYAYYPGCCMHATAQEYDSSWRAVAEALGIELAEMPGWNCCGTVHATNVGRLVSIGLAARNLGIAERLGLDLIAPCSGCYKNLRTSAQALRADSALRAEVNQHLAQPYEGAVVVKHPLYVILQDVGLEALGKPKRPLKGLKVAPYYGCVLTRPVDPEPVDDPENPQGLDQLLERLGAEVVDYYPSKTKCCGGGVLLSHTDIALDLTGKLLRQAKRVGADCLAVACPMCQMVLDAYQYQVEGRLHERFDLPILYFTQLMGLAMGIDERRLGLNKLFVSPAPVLGPAA